MAQGIDDWDYLSLDDDSEMNEIAARLARLRRPRKGRNYVPYSRGIHVFQIVRHVFNI